MARVKQLRKIALALDISGTAVPITNTKLYKGGFAFVELQTYVPVTQNRSPDSEPLCTVYRTVVDEGGNRKQFNNDIYNLMYIETVKLNGADYLMFECPLPKAFTDTAGELELVFNYSEIQGGKVIARLASNIYNTYVQAGGAAEGETIDPTGGELARLNDLTIKMEQLENSVDELVAPPDVSEANLVGIPNVEITPEGNLKFSYLKGEPGNPGDPDTITESEIEALFN